MIQQDTTSFVHPATSDSVSGSVVGIVSDSISDSAVSSISDSVVSIVQEPMPIDSAFLGGCLSLSRSAGAGHPVSERENSFLTESLIIISTVLIIIFIRKTVNIIPSMLSCITRWKEVLNLEFSAKLSRDRDIVFLIMFVPFCLIADRYRMYNPSFIQGMSSDAALLVTIGAATAYFILKVLMFYILKGKKINLTTYFAAGKAFATFFCAACTFCLTTAGILSLSGLDDNTIRTVLLYMIGAFYLLLILRVFQIFSHSCNVLTTILYLCSLELFPTGLLVASVLII